MTRFLDGPAAGVTLFLRRAPVYLRAVCDSSGKWDAHGEILAVLDKALAAAA